MSDIILLIYSAGAVNSIYGLLVMSFLIVFLRQMLKYRKVYLNGINSIGFFLLFAFGFSYVLIGEFSTQGLLYYFFCPLLAYLTGWTLAEYSNVNAENRIKRMIFAIMVGYSIHALLNYIINIGHKRWELTDFFSGSLRAATGSGCINTLAFSLLMYIIVMGKGMSQKMIGLGCVLPSILYAFLLGSRTQFLILGIVSFLFLAIWLFEKYGIKSVLLLILIVSLLVGSGIYIYQHNILGVKLYIDSSNLMTRYQIGYDIKSTDNYRTSSVMRGLNNVFSYPLGGLKEISYYHNFWLDIGRVSGVFPFLSMVVYTVFVNLHMMSIFKDRHIDDRFRYLIFCSYLGYQVNFFVEPVLEGLIDFFFVFTIINGMIECYYYHAIKDKHM